VPIDTTSRCRLPAVFADESVFCDPDVLAIVERVAGKSPVMCQLAVKFRFCDVTADNGPFETTLGTQRIRKKR
jgi:hypothetical protein